MVVPSLTKCIIFHCQWKEVHLYHTLRSHIYINPFFAPFVHLQVEACNSEAERIESLIGSRSPTLVSYLELSPLLFASAHTVHFEHMESLYTVGSSAAHVTLLWTAFLCTVISSHLLLALSFHSISSYNWVPNLRIWNLNPKTYGQDSLWKWASRGVLIFTRDPYF